MINKIWSSICICLLVTACHEPVKPFLQKTKEPQRLDEYLREVHQLPVNDSIDAAVFIFYPNNCGSCSVKLQNFISEILPLLNKPYAIIISGEKKNT